MRESRSKLPLERSAVSRGARAQEERVEIARACQRNELSLSGRPVGPTRRHARVERDLARRGRPSRLRLGLTSWTSAIEEVRAFERFEAFRVVVFVEGVEILAQGALEQRRLLRDERDALAQSLERDLGDVELRQEVINDLVTSRLVRWSQRTPLMRIVPLCGSTKRSSEVASVLCQTDLTVRMPGNEGMISHDAAPFHCQSGRRLRP